MDIQKEREEFQNFCEQNFDFERHEQTYFDEQTQSYENDIGEDTESINMAWSAWQARAQKVAVPILTNKMICAIERKVEEQLLASAITADPFRLDGEKIFYAMIEAQED